MKQLITAELRSSPGTEMEEKKKKILGQWKLFRTQESMLSHNYKICTQVFGHYDYLAGVVSYVEEEGIVIHTWSFYVQSLYIRWGGWRSRGWPLRRLIFIAFIALLKGKRFVTTRPCSRCRNVRVSGFNGASAFWLSTFKQLFLCLKLIPINYTWRRNAWCLSVCLSLSHVWVSCSQLCSELCERINTWSINSIIFVKKYLLNWSFKIYCKHLRPKQSRGVEVLNQKLSLWTYTQRIGTNLKKKKREKEAEMNLQLWFLWAQINTDGRIL